MRLPLWRPLRYDGCVALTLVVWVEGREAARFPDITSEEVDDAVHELQRLFPGSRVLIEETRWAGAPKDVSARSGSSPPQATELPVDTRSRRWAPKDISARSGSSPPRATELPVDARSDTWAASNDGSARGGASGTPWAEAPKDAQLAHHLLFDSYQRAATIQAHCVKEMVAAAREMNHCFLDQLDGMQTRHQAAMERLDTIAFERKMMEHEASARHLSDHFRRLAEDERRANAPSIAEQLAQHLLALLNVVAHPTEK